MSSFEKFSDKMIDKVFKRRLSFFMRLAISLLVLIIVLIYFVLPISKVSNCDISGNYFYSNDEVLNILGLKKDNYLYDVNKEKCLAKINNHPLFENSKIDLNPFSLKIYANEIAPVYKDFDNKVYFNNDNIYYMNTTFENEIINNKYQDSLLRIPYLISEKETYSNSVLKLIRGFILSYVGRLSMNVDYVDFKYYQDSPDGDLYFYLPLNDFSKQNYFTSNYCYFVFLINASDLTYYNNNSIKDDYAKLSKVFMQAYNDLSKAYFNPNVDKAKIDEVSIKDNIYQIKMFRLNIKSKENKIYLSVCE